MSETNLNNLGINNSGASDVDGANGNDANHADDASLSLIGLDMPLLQQWVGKSMTAMDDIAVVSAAALSAVLEHAAAPDAGAALAPLWHWIYFWSVAAQSELGSDGHPPRGHFLPPVPLPRRMWAGGRIRFEQPLLVGTSAVRHSRIVSVTKKSGQRGSLAFVTVSHAIVQNGVLAINEEHDIVYRALAQPGDVPPAPKLAPATSMFSRTINPDPVLLFRYSALTFNSHRIHYDRSYATGVEGYPGLVVHGPLIATLLVDLLLKNMPEPISAGAPQAHICTFDFRAISPLFDTEPFDICGEFDPDGCTVRLWANNSRGELAMEAVATTATTETIAAGPQQ